MIWTPLFAWDQEYYSFAGDEVVCWDARKGVSISTKDAQEEKAKFKNKIIYCIFFFLFNYIITFTWKNIYSVRLKNISNKTTEKIELYLIVVYIKF